MKIALSILSVVKTQHLLPGLGAPAKLASSSATHARCAISLHRDQLTKAGCS
jgi:hypothetical protein